MKPDPSNTPDAKQTDDHVQSSALGSVNPKFTHPGSGKLVPVSAATPDDEPKAERKHPPERTGHDIDEHSKNSSTTPAVPLVPVNDGSGDFRNTQTGAIVSNSAGLTREQPAPNFPKVTPGLPPKTPTSV